MSQCGCGYTTNGRMQKFLPWQSNLKHFTEECYKAKLTKLVITAWAFTLKGMISKIDVSYELYFNHQMGILRFQT